MGGVVFRSHADRMTLLGSRRESIYIEGMDMLSIGLGYIFDAALHGVWEQETGLLGMLHGVQL